MDHTHATALFLLPGGSMSIAEKTRNGMATQIRTAWAAFDVRDVFILGGLGSLGYGLYLWKGLWLACMAGGGLLMIIGYLMRDK